MAIQNFKLVVGSFQVVCHCSSEQITESISLSATGQFCSSRLMAWEENVTGCHLSSFSMDRTVLVAKSEASVSSLN